jgi:hypothetical protein
MSVIFKHSPKGLFENNNNNLLIANNAFNRKSVYLTPDDYHCHWHVLGGTGKGKSKFLEHIFKEFVRLKHGVCLIDPHGDLYDRLTKYISRYGLEDKTILIDPNEDEWIVGLNYLEKIETTEKGIHDMVGLVLRAFQKVFGELDEGAKPRFERWGRNTLYPLIENHYTLVETRDFLNFENPTIRAHILGQLKDEFYQKEWIDFERYSSRDKVNLLESVLNRINKFVGHERIRRIVGQAKSTVDFRKAMDEGKIILINLAPKKFGHDIKNMLGVMLIDMIVEAATSRSNIPENKRRPFFLMVDEFGELVCDDFAYALDSCRKYKVRLILAHQRLFQLKEDYPNVYDAVMSNTDIKFTFGISRDNAEIMAKEMFTGKIRGDIIKNVIEQTKFEPVQSWETIRSESHVEGSGQGSGRSNSSGSNQSSFQSYAMNPDQGLYFSDALGLTMGTGQTSNTASSESFFESRSDVDGYSETQVPITHYRPFKEVTNITYWTPEELLEKFIAWIKTQSPRHGQLKTGQKGPIAVVTPWIDDVIARAKDVEKSKQKILPTCAKPIKEIELELAARQQFLLSPPAAKPYDSVIKKANIEEAEFEDIPPKIQDKDIMKEEDYWT